MFDLWLIMIIVNLWEGVSVSMTGFKWYLAIQTVILEITWFIMLWYCIYQGGFGLWVGWFVCGILATFSSICFAASILGGFDEFKDEASIRGEK